MAITFFTLNKAHKKCSSHSAARENFIVASLSPIKADNKIAEIKSSFNFFPVARQLNGSKNLSIIAQQILTT